MYYVLFHYQQGMKDLRINGFKHESDVIDFIHEEYKEIEVHRILEVKAEYRLGLIVTEDYVRSELEPEEETESLVELGTKPEEIIKENKKSSKK